MTLSFFIYVSRMSMGFLEALRLDKIIQVGWFIRIYEHKVIGLFRRSKFPNIINSWSELHFYLIRRKSNGTDVLLGDLSRTTSCTNIMNGEGLEPTKL